MLQFTKGQLIGIGAVLVALAGGLAAGATLFDQTAAPAPVISSPTPTVSPSSTPAADAAPDEDSAAGNSATVTGKRIFPAEAIPADFQVCAVNQSDQKITCVPGNDPQYRLTLAPGQYQFFAMVPSFDANYHAFYSNFVTCGLKAECSDHSPITVTVNSGQTVTGIDVGDFYKR